MYHATEKTRAWLDELVDSYDDSFSDLATVESLRHSISKVAKAHPSLLIEKYPLSDPYQSSLLSFEPDEVEQLRGVHDLFRPCVVYLDMYEKVKTNKPGAGARSPKKLKGTGELEKCEILLRIYGAVTTEYLHEKVTHIIVDPVINKREKEAWEKRYGDMRKAIKAYKVEKRGMYVVWCVCCVFSLFFYFSLFIFVSIPIYIYKSVFLFLSLSLSLSPYHSSHSLTPLLSLSLSVVNVSWVQESINLGCIQSEGRYTPGGPLAKRTLSWTRSPTKPMEETEKDMTGAMRKKKKERERKEEKEKKRESLKRVKLTNA